MVSEWVLCGSGWLRLSVGGIALVVLVSLTSGEVAPGYLRCVAEFICEPSCLLLNDKENCRIA